MANQVTRCPNAVLQSPNAAQIVDGPSLVPLPPQKKRRDRRFVDFFFHLFQGGGFIIQQKNETTNEMLTSLMRFKQT